MVDELGQSCSLGEGTREGAGEEAHECEAWSPKSRFFIALALCDVVVVSYVDRHVGR